MKDVTVVIPVYKEDSVIVTKTYQDLKSMGANVIVVEDGSTMDLPPTVNTLRYVPNMGYGYALKRGIEKADTAFIITMDGDGQHTADDVRKIYTMFKLVTNCDMVVGCRWNLNEKPLRWIGRKILNFIASLLARHYLIDLNSGMRMFKRETAMGYMPILCDTFSFTTSLTMSMVTDGHKIAWFPIDVQPRAHGKSHVRVVQDGLITLWFILWIGFALRTRKARKWLRSLGQ